MKTFSSFIFEKIGWNHHARKVVLRYSLDGSITFEETLMLPNEPFTNKMQQRMPQIQKALFALHLIGGISYFKTCIPRKMILETGTLSRTEAKFWNSVYENGLGEFFFKNNIDFKGLINFPETEVKPEESAGLRTRLEPNPMKRVLVPIGGGKDSIVTAELLKKSGVQVTLLRMGSHPLIDELAHQSGLPMLTVKRSISGNLFDLNEQGALNGHVPITAYLSVLSVLVALLYDFDAVVMSNERSANEGNVTFKGMDINHQWSKSIMFEKALRRYVTETIGTSIEYFSLLRPLSELRIAEIFTGFPQYFPHTTSCNTNWKLLKKSQKDGGGLPREARSAAKSEVWCNKCPKCAFVFCCLSAFLPKAELEKMFGTNLFEHDWLLPLYRELLGTVNFKPLECVGTSDETKAAFLLAMKRNELNDTPVIKMFMKEVLPTIKDPEALIAAVMKPSEQHCIPKTFLPMIFDNRGLESHAVGS
ncbi:hypothetical protein EXS65_04885 [Candidatus Peribacteria bacterium]|nr:hypothetical protein [Candidatus Peribacteria bacterium]